MPVKIMKTLRDISGEISDQTLSPQPLLTDDYTYGNINGLERDMEARLDDQEEAFDDIDLEEHRREEKENLEAKQQEDIRDENRDLDCGCE